MIFLRIFLVAFDLLLTVAGIKVVMDDGGFIKENQFVILMASAAFLSACYISSFS